MPTHETAYFPMAVEIDRCEGLCHLPNSECMPVEKETILIPVQEVKVTPVLMSSVVTIAPKCLEYKVEKHLKCKCVCKIKAEDCNAQQTFAENSCRCICKNNTSSDCEKQSKVWNPQTCRCECPPELSTICSSGFEFNDQSCTCESKQTRLE
ncbi:hypothetical protein B4U80_12696 [Leptotrombidium deliense]|uniref:Platelet-derived growth factor (PDGF) family profile domain-containing protein n=1 Tax=Leptotrombidium deliense TaxID=299467 RepID=A0A443SQH3_9ACAR|nr:hypothetical protein B4U80_12696 [Leptotrombidium deliense]